MVGYAFDEELCPIGFIEEFGSLSNIRLQCFNAAASITLMTIGSSAADVTPRSDVRTVSESRGVDAPSILTTKRVRSKQRKSGTQE